MSRGKLPHRLPRGELLRKYGVDLIKALSRETMGVGDSKATQLVGVFPAYAAFRKSTLKQLVCAENDSGRRILNEAAARGIFETKGRIPVGYDVRLAWVFTLARGFARSVEETIASQGLDTLDVNPFLLEALGLTTPADVLPFVLYQSVTRSIVTAWGGRVEKMLQYSGCFRPSSSKKEAGSNWDLAKRSGKGCCYLQIKSGPNTMNVGMAIKLRHRIRGVGKPNRAMLGMTYGTRSSVSTQISGTLMEKDYLVGRELWQFIGGRGYHLMVKGAIAAAAASILVEGRGRRKNVVKLLDGRRSVLVRELTGISFRDKGLSKYFARHF